MHSSKKDLLVNMNIYCISEITCLNPATTDLDESSQKKMEFSCPDGFAYGAKCQLSCSDGNPVQGAKEISCDKNSTNIGFWWYGNAKPYCDSEFLL